MRSIGSHRSDTLIELPLRQGMSVAGKHLQLPIVDRLADLVCGAPRCAASRAGQINAMASVQRKLKKRFTGKEPPETQ